MSYNHYVAICKPLHDTIIMNNRVCFKILIGCYLIALIIVILSFSMGFELEFCDSNVIDHFGCGAALILKITQGL
ncbi:Olfactory receptor 6C68 [Pteropus alecto]|uniref:Olfactory receptor 6C68 n=1 Tax=Pteropus alecto TaxID=9402 RepID=L5KR28_PTEAL|nr:Olfactory receptor 6C68 [Pteropus alecto]